MRGWEERFRLQGYMCRVICTWDKHAHEDKNIMVPCSQPAAWQHHSTPPQITLLQRLGLEELQQRAGSTICYVRRWKGSLSHTATCRHTNFTKWLFPEPPFLPLLKVTWSNSVLQTSQEYTRRMPRRATKNWTFRISYPEFTVKLGPNSWEGHTLPSCFLCNCVWHANWSPGQLCLIFSFDSTGVNQNHLYERVTD